MYFLVGTGTCSRLELRDCCSINLRGRGSLLTTFVQKLAKLRLFYILYFSYKMSKRCSMSKNKWGWEDGSHSRFATRCMEEQANQFWKSVLVNQYGYFQRVLWQIEVVAYHRFINVWDIFRSSALKVVRWLHTSGGRLREVLTIVIWMETFWYFGTCLLTKGDRLRKMVA